MHIQTSWHTHLYFLRANSECSGAVTVVPANFPEMHSGPVLMLGQGRRLDLYLKSPASWFYPSSTQTKASAPESQNVTHKHAHTTLSENCTCGFSSLTVCHAAVTQNRKNPEMILPDSPCLLHANGRLMGEMDPIDRLPSSQQKQRQHSDAAKRPYLKRGV